MLKRLLMAIPITVLSGLITTTVLSSTLYQYTVISETDAGQFYGSGPKTTRFDTGYGGTSKQYYQQTGGNSYSYGAWYCNGSLGSTAYWHWWVGIPYNTGPRDGVVRYYAYNNDSSENFSIVVDQESFGNYFAYIGYTKGTGGGMGSSCYTSMSNACISGRPCSSSYEVWWDANKYYPSAGTAPPKGHHPY